MCDICNREIRNEDHFKSKHHIKAFKEALGIGTCHGKNHQHSDSIYEKDNVPLKLFKKECRHCLDCKNLSDPKFLKEKYKDSIKRNDDFLFCTGCRHKGSRKISKELFRSDMKDPTSSLLKTCYNCHNRHDIKMKNAQEKNLYWCSFCYTEILESERAVNKHGDILAACISCNKIKNHLARKRKLKYNKIKLEFIADLCCCCNICRNIFIINPIDPNLFLEIKTEIYNDILHLKYEEEIYQAIDFIELNKDKLMLKILQFDHLTEQEQRDRGLLKPEDPFIPKKKGVSNMGSETSMRLEAKKCQLVCGKCHKKETERRELGLSRRTTKQQLKIDYVNELKNAGCSKCNYKDNTLPRFFHFDHIDPTTKIAGISEMIYTNYNKYSFEDLVAEIAKCQLLCEYCHFKRTEAQHANSEITTTKKKLS